MVRDGRRAGRRPPCGGTGEELIQDVDSESRIQLNIKEEDPGSLWFSGGCFRQGVWRSRVGVVGQVQRLDNRN